MNLDIKRVVGYRNFCNKLWNAMRFALPLVSDLSPSRDMATNLLASGKLAVRDRFILSRLNVTIRECNKNLEEYQFGNTVQVNMKNKCSFLYLTYSDAWRRPLLIHWLPFCRSLPNRCCTTSGFMTYVMSTWNRSSPWSTIRIRSKLMLGKSMQKYTGPGKGRKTNR